MDVASPVPFATLLRRYRLAAGFSQEALAERAHLSLQAIGALERGVRRTPHRPTVDLLADALALTDEERAQLHASVSRRRGPATAPRTRRNPATSTLPLPATSFVGRAQEQATVLRLLASTRLLTLTGTGGVGKTRLALQVAAACTDRYPDGVRFLDLSTLVDSDLVPQVMAQTLGLREQPGRPLDDMLAEALREKTLLLLLDNCEHLRAAAGGLAELLLRTCPGVRLLATSREPLGAIGETVWWVPSLAIPKLEFRVPQNEGAGAEAGASNAEAPRSTPAARVFRAEAAELFCTRAQSAHPAFVLTDANAPAVAAICRQLDGIPLAIELAAARARILTPEQIAARLDQRLRLLTGGSPDAPSRQQTLTAALDWSYDLLTVPERRLLERLSVFVGGCTIEAAEAVCIGDDVTADALFDLLSSLVEKSLLAVEYCGEAARYRMLETVRQYAAEHLIAAGESSVLRRRHRDWYRALAQRVAPELRTNHQQPALDSLDAEHDNMRAALAWCRTDPDSSEAGLLLAAALRLFWFMRGHPGEGRRWLEGALVAGAHAPAQMRAVALDGAAALAHSQGDYAAARTLEEQAVGLWRETEDKRGMAGALSTLGIILKSEGAIEQASAVLEESLALMREVQDQAGIAVALNNLAALAIDRGDWASVTTFGEESLAIKRQTGDRSGVAVTLHNLAEAARYRGEYEQAIILLRESLSLFRDLGNTHATAQSLHSLGIVMHYHGDSVRARALLAESLSLFSKIDERWGIALCLEGLAMIAASSCAWDRATRLLGAAEALRAAIGAPLPPVDRPEYDRMVAAIRTALSESIFMAAWNAGRAAPLDEAIALALRQPSAA